MVCRCEEYELLDRLNDEASEDTLESFDKLLDRLLEEGDEYAEYIRACIVTPEDAEPDNEVVYERQLEQLVKKNNPWALAELGLQYIFASNETEKRTLGRRYLLLGSLLGEKRAQYYVAHRLIADEECIDLAKRLLVASEAQGYERAIENFEHLISKVETIEASAIR